MQMPEVPSILTAEEQGLKLTAVSVALTAQVLKQARSPACPDDYHVNGLLPACGQPFWMHLAAFNLLGLFEVVGLYVLLIVNFSRAQIHPCVSPSG